MSIQFQHLAVLLLICLVSHNLFAESTDLFAESTDDVHFSNALLLEGNGNYENAVESYELAIKNIEIISGSFSQDLIEPLMGIARSEFSLSNYEEAIVSLTRAQHLIHRSQGVYAERQQEGINLLINTHLALDDVKLADKQHKFKLFLSEHNVGADGIELLPALDVINRWYIQTGQFNRAKKSLQRSLEIIRSMGGEFDSLQTDILIQLAKVRRLNRFCCSHKILEEGIGIIDANPNFDNQEKGRYYLELADAYILGGKVEEAKMYYKKAWTLMNDVNRELSFAAPKGIEIAKAINNRYAGNSKIFLVDRDRFGARHFEEVSKKEQRTLDSLPPQEFRFTADKDAPKRLIRDTNTGSTSLSDNELRVIGFPYQFNRSQLQQILPYNLHKPEFLATLSIELTLTVDADGRTRQVEVITPNIPIKLSRLMRDAVNRSYFRPRFENGIAVTTTDFRIIQRFEP